MSDRYIEEFTVRVEKLAGSDRVVSIKHFFNGVPHREDGPAEQDFRPEDGTPFTETWIRHGITQREDGPAYLAWNRAGTELLIEQWKGPRGLHRVGGPADIYRENSILTEEVYYYEGLQHNENGPSRIGRDGKTGHIFIEEWRRYGSLHRGGGLPAIIHKGGRNDQIVEREEYWEDGRRHRIGGPALIERTKRGKIKRSDYYELGALIQREGLTKKFTP